MYRAFFSPPVPKRQGSLQDGEPMVRWDSFLPCQVVFLQAIISCSQCYGISEGFSISKQSQKERLKLQKNKVYFLQSKQRSPKTHPAIKSRMSQIGLRPPFMLQMMPPLSSCIRPWLLAAIIYYLSRYIFWHSVDLIILVVSQ